MKFVLHSHNFPINAKPDSHSFGGLFCRCMICHGSFFARCKHHNRSLSNPDPLANVSFLEMIPTFCSHPSISSGDVVMGMASFPHGAKLFVLGCRGR
ncbi:hypothetical protein EUGRSUZ_C01679 [Eucalyptus grandis]|uniref:Uncharacterized protein n=2 Tax=Eucalyptus grandis TaxID=71139 RepID=A0ACC3LDZ2_EUCGR|nr:hypothetical protein EUGRSUZ_C01679 [Eucalyptus grandis]